MLSSDYFNPAADWKALASEIGYPCPSTPGPSSLEAIQPMEMNVASWRVGQAESDAEWAADHPPKELGYEVRSIMVRVRDGAEINVRVTYPGVKRLGDGARKALPVIFVTHGGGWVQGSHLSEEAWVLWDLYKSFEIVVVSVEYRMAPEHKYPAWIEDSWDILQDVLSRDSSTFSNVDVTLDRQRVVLAGSSSGAGITAVLSQMCRDANISIVGVILNVPVLCDYRHFPAEYSDSTRLSSYQECVDTYSSGAMVGVWNLIIPSEILGSDPKASPLLGNCAHLPPHFIAVAGQDALRDEGIAYSSKLRASGVTVNLEVYAGVPHDFARHTDLKATIAFQEHLRTALRKLL